MVYLRYIGSGYALDNLDESARMRMESVREYVLKFTSDLSAICATEYLKQRPGKDELKEVQEVYSEFGFPGCIGPVD